MKKRMWINIKDQKPEEDQKVFYYFEHTGIGVGKYNIYIWPKEVMGFDEIVNGDCFHGHGGWLIDDVTHWMPRSDGDNYPLPPEKNN